jgi:hypothetical protein
LVLESYVNTVAHREREREHSMDEVREVIRIVISLGNIANKMDDASLYVKYLVCTKIL